MNKALLLKIADAIEAESIGDFPIGFDMKTWGSSDSKHTCGTVACVAGYANAIEVLEKSKSADKKAAVLRRARRKKDHQWSLFSQVSEPYSFYRGMELLDLTKDEAVRLFVPNDIPYINANSDLVPDALRWIALTGIISWSRALDAAWCIRENEKR